MDKVSHSNHDNSNNVSNVGDKDKGGGGDGSGSLLLRTSSDGIRQSTTSDLGLQWGNRKRLRCMKVQVKHDSSNPVQRTTVRVDRRVVRTEKDSSNRPIASITDNSNSNNYNQSNGYPNLRQRPLSPQQPPPRILRNSETSSAMRGGQTNGSVKGISSPDRDVHDKRGTHSNNHINEHNNKSVASSTHEKGGSPSGSGDAPVWPPKFVIALTNKEKEEDFLAIKGSKLPQRPKKRAKFIQRTLNLVSPGTWLCDLTLERYEVREKKISKSKIKREKSLYQLLQYVVYIILYILIR